MKKSKRVLFSGLIVASLAATMAYADGQNGKATCEKWVGDYNDVHCAYISGLESGNGIGRYIKQYDSMEDMSYTRCITADLVVDDVMQEMAEYYVGTRSVEYSICTDAKAEHCEPVGTDSYSVAKSGEKYVGTPALFAIDLSAVKDKYAECRVSDREVNPAMKPPFTSKKR
jgi:hypothetical protein